MGSRTFKEGLYAEFAVLGKALANARRLRLLNLLAQGERSVEELAREAALSLADASAHLQVLHRARLVEAEKRGLNVVYRLSGPEVFRLWRTLRDVGSARLAEIDRLVAIFSPTSKTWVHDSPIRSATRSWPPNVAWSPSRRQKIRRSVSTEENRAVFRRYVEEVFNKGNLDLVDEVFATYVAHQPDGHAEERGPENVKRFVREFREAFPTAIPQSRIRSPKGIR